MMTYALMLTGAGSAGTGGGVKVTTVMILILAVWSELRGDPDTHAFGRRVSPGVQREALAVVGLAVAVLMLATVVLSLVTEGVALTVLIYEAISAFGNVGLSMGITADLPPAAQGVIILLMYLGRVGIVTVATGLALRARRADYHYPRSARLLGRKITPSAESVVVIGLGRFGRAVAESLQQLGHEVLAIDESAQIVQELSGNLAHVVQAILPMSKPCGNWMSAAFATAWWRSAAIWKARCCRRGVVRTGGARHLGQGCDRKARQDPGKDRRPSRRLSGKDHGRAGGASGHLEDHRLHRIR